MTEKCWQDTILGKGGELAWCLFSLFPLIPLAIIWLVLFLFGAIQTTEMMTIVMLTVGLLFVVFHGMRITFSFLRLYHVVQCVFVDNLGKFEGKYYFNRKFRFKYEDIGDVKDLEPNQTKNSIGNYADMAFIIILKDGTRLSVLDTMDDYEGLLETLKTSFRRV